MTKQDLIVKPAKSKADDLAISAVFRRVDKTIKAMDMDNFNDVQKIVIEDGAGLYAYVSMLFSIKQSTFDFPSFSASPDVIASRYLEWIERDSDEVDAFYTQYQNAIKVALDPKTAPSHEVSDNVKK